MTGPDPQLDAVLRRLLADHHAWARTLTSDTMRETVAPAGPESNRFGTMLAYGTHTIERAMHDLAAGDEAASNTLLSGLYSVLIATTELCAVIGTTPSQVVEHVRTICTRVDAEFAAREQA